MKRHLTRNLQRALTVIGAAMAAVLMMAASALAHHKPVILDHTDVLPWKAPLILDGTDAIGLMGTVPHAGAVRSAQFNMEAGKQIELLYSIPDQAPENTLDSDELPLVTLIAPNGRVTFLTPDMREPVGEGGFNVLFLRQYFATAISGTYSIVVIGRAPARFLVSIGPEGNHEFHGIERGEIATDEQVLEWFTTQP